MITHSQPNPPLPPDLRGKGVLVTGCSSGIGRATAVYLAQQGFTVFATVRKQADAENLSRLGEPNLVPTCPLDLTRPEHIPPAIEFVAGELDRRGQEGLYAAVNNAGGGEVAPLELVDMDRFRRELETRLVGPLALLQALLPAIRRARGRILWIATPALIPIPNVGTIHTCDFAANCLARTLHLELRPWDIPVIQVRCGGIQTAAVQSEHPTVPPAQQRSPDRYALYAQALAKQEDEFAEFDRKRTAPVEVAKVVCRALVARKPRRRYKVGHMAGLAALIEPLPHPLVDWIMARR